MATSLIKSFQLHPSAPPTAVKLMPNPPADLSLARKMLCAGSAACVADLMTFPFDVAKVRLQMTRVLTSGTSGLAQPTGLSGTLMHMVRTEGLASCWNGIIPGLQRQCVFASIRIGLYDNVKDFYSDKFGVKNSGSSVMAVRLLSGITSGAIAISIAQPTDVVKVRMQAQRNTSSGAAAMTTSSLAMYRQIFRTAGLSGLWTGLLPNMARNSLVNATELVCYDSIKQSLLEAKLLEDGLPCHIAAGFSAGFMATLVASPIDVVKTRVMSGSATGFWSAASTLARESGFFGFYKG
jgi:solute carrier family 25 uncoupling protein 8/9